MSKATKKSTPARTKINTTSPVRIVLEIVVRNESSLATSAVANILPHAMNVAAAPEDGFDLTYATTGSGITLLSLSVGTFHIDTPSNSGGFHLDDIPLTGKVRVMATAVKGSPTGNGGLTISNGAKTLLDKEFDFQQSKASINQLIQL